MFGCIQDTLVVVVDNLFSVIHATVADLDGTCIYPCDFVKGAR